MLTVEQLEELACVALLFAFLGGLALGMFIARYTYEATTRAYLEDARRIRERDASKRAAHDAITVRKSGVL